MVVVFLVVCGLKFGCLMLFGVLFGVLALCCAWILVSFELCVIWLAFVFGSVLYCVVVTTF